MTGTLQLMCASMAAGCLTVAAATTVTLQEKLGVDWTNELVHYRLEFPASTLFLPDAVQVAPEDGAPIPSQLSDVERHPDGSIAACRIWFRVNLPAGAKASYTLTPGPRAPAHNGVEAVDDGESITLGTLTPAGRIGIRLPSGSRTYDWPIPAADAPGPVQALLLPSGRETGRGRFEVPFEVKSYHAEVTDNGPLFAEARVRYVFDTGFWTFIARVEDGSQTILIREEFDTGYSGQQMATSMLRHQTNWQPVDRFYSLLLGGADADGFRPQHIYYGANNNDPAFMDLLPRTVPEGFPEIRNNWFAAPIHGFNVAWDRPGAVFFLSGYASVLPRVGRIARVLEPGGEAIGLIGLHSDRWHNPMSLHLRVTPQRELALSLPLQAYEQEWRSDGFGRFSPNYTGKMLFHPPYLTKRSYGIVLGEAGEEPQDLLRDLFAVGASQAISLDEVKEMILDWADPVDPGKGAPETTDKGRDVLDYLRRRVEIMRAAGDLARFSMAYHHGFGQGDYRKTREVVANAASELTADDRREMRRLLAFFAYDMHSLRRFPYGTGFHHNNPNMTIMAVDARMKALSLVEGHPMAPQWGAESVNLARAFIRRYTRDSGAPFENPHYIFGVTLGQLSSANEIMLEQGVGDAFDNELFRRMLHFLPHWLSPPDPRFLGHRLVLPLGNGSYQSVAPDIGARLVRYLAPRHPDLAGEMQWLVNQTLPDEEHLTFVDDRVPVLESRHFEDYGVSFRHGFGTPYETLFHMLAGNCFGHYEIETDQMAYTLYAKGQPIHLHFGNGYFPMFVRPWLRNRVSIDHKWEIPERHEPRVEAVALGDSVDYVHAMKPIDQIQGRTEYPPERGQPDEHALNPQPVEDIPLTEWRRQVAFLKDPDPRGPNYFVLRDSFTGTPTRPTDLSLWFLSNDMLREGDRFHFAGQCDVDMDVFVAEPVNAEIETGEYGHVQQPYGRRVGFDPNYHPDGKLGETQQLLRLKQPAGKGYLVVLYPRLKENDPEAVFTRLGQAAVRVETTLSTDYTFLNPYATRFEDERVRFEGMACSVRFFNSGTVSVINLDGTVNVRAGGHVVSGRGPFEVRLHADAAPDILPDNAEVTVTRAP